MNDFRCSEIKSVPGNPRDPRRSARRSDGDMNCALPFDPKRQGHAEESRGGSVAERRIGRDDLGQARAQVHMAQRLFPSCPHASVRRNKIAASETLPTDPCAVRFGCVEWAIAKLRIEWYRRAHPSTLPDFGPPHPDLSTALAGTPAPLCVS